MIRPSSMQGLPEAAGKSTRWVVAFYFLSFALSMCNFVPMWSGGYWESGPVPRRTVYLLYTCYMLSAPLLFEYIMDVMVWLGSHAADKNQCPRFSNLVMILSMFLPFFIIDGSIESASSQYNVLFINCFVAFLQTLILVAQYRKLQDRHWSIGASLICIALFVASQMAFTYSLLHGQDGYNSLDNKPLTISLALSIAFGFVCAVCHQCFSKLYLYEYLISLRRGKVPAKWDTNDYLFFLLQSMTSVYFIINFFISIVFLINRYDSQYYLNTAVTAHIVLGLVAAMLPGRVVSKNLIVLNEKMVNKDTFIRYVSHEIRSPLSTTSLGLKYLLDKLSLNSIDLDEVQNVVQESLVTCELAMNTLNDFLMLDKIQSNVLDVSATVCQASDFLVDAIRPFSLQAQSNKVMLMCNVESLDGITCPHVSIRVDVYKMNQVLRNLLSNAFKFTPLEGRVTVTMTLQESTAEESFAVSDSRKYRDGSCSMVKFAVTDSGCGISKENLPKLFGQYVQIDADKLQGGKGSGLGLWLSKAIVEMHGGRIGATSEGIGKGCTFWFELPCELSLEDRAVLATATATHSHRGSFVSKDFSAVKNIDTRRSSSVPSSKSDDLVVRDIESGLSGKMTSSMSETPKHLLSNHQQQQQQQTPEKERKFLDLDLDRGGSAKLKSIHRIKSNTKLSEEITEPVRLLPLRVLLVDDSIIARKMVERSMKGIDAVVSHANNGREAVEKVAEAMERKESFDVILIDHYMPEMNGPEAVQLIRQGGFVGVIFGVSGMSADEEFEQLVECGKLNRIMVKPFNLDVFLDNMKGYEVVQ